MFANTTRDEAGNWRALSRGQDDLHENTASLNIALESRARHLLHTRYGYDFELRQISRDGTTAWRVAGSSEDQVRACSTRQRRIEEYSWATFQLPFDQLNERQKKYCQDKTRPGKNTERHTAGLDNLAGFTRAALHDAGLPEQIITSHPGRNYGPDVTGDPWQQSWDQQVRVAAAAIARRATEKAQEFRFADARALALHALPGLPPDRQDQLVAAALSHPDIVSVEALAETLGAPTAKWRGVYTTRDVLAADQELKAALRQGAELRRHTLGPEQIAQSITDFERSAGFTLSAEQRQSVEIVCGSIGAFAAIQGAAGSGKTTVQAAVVYVYSRAGVSAYGAATAGVAKEILAAEAAIDASTIASLIGIRNTDFQPDQDRAWAKVGDVLIVDEAAMVDRRDLARLATESVARGKKLVVVGDSEQLAAIGATGGFDTIYGHCRDHAAAARLFEVRRQQNAHEKRALEHWRARRYTDAIGEYLTAGNIRVVDTHSNALKLAAQLYRDRAGDGDGLDRAKRVTLIAARNGDAAAVGYMSRAAARADGLLRGPDCRFNTPGGWIDLAEGELILLKANQKMTDSEGQITHLRNGRRAVIDRITADGDLHMRWPHPDGIGDQRAVITAADIKDGNVLPGYVARGQVLHGAGASTHSTQGGTVDWSVIVGAGMDSPNLAYVGLP